MVCEAVEEFPQESVAVHALVMLYEPAQFPGVVTSLNVNLNALPQLSVAFATANTGVAGQLMVEGAGKAAITGAEIS
jgi:TATA-box binding protein (TBP) (component of TFIID and TFIIIB)